MAVAWAPSTEADRSVTDSVYGAVCLGTASGVSLVQVLNVSMPFLHWQDPSRVAGPGGGIVAG